MIARMQYSGQESFDKAMEPGKNRAVDKDLMSVAKGKVSVVVAEYI